jgi:hypothetical protein
MRGADRQGGDSRIRDTTNQANIEAGPVLPLEGRKVWPRKGYSTPTDAEKSGEPYRPVRKA